MKWSTVLGIIAIMWTIGLAVVGALAHAFLQDPASDESLLAFLEDFFKSS